MENTVKNEPEKRKPGRPKGSICAYKVGRQGFTKAKEIFCQEIAMGTNPVAAYRKAYKEKTTNRTDASCSGSARRLLDRLVIQERIEEIKKTILLEVEKEYSWEREEAIKKLKYLCEISEEEINRVSEGRNEQLQIYEEMLDEELQKEKPNITKMREIREMIASIKQKKSISMTQITAIKGAVEELNHMHGFNETNINNNISGDGVVEIQFDYGDEEE